MIVAAFTPGEPNAIAIVFFVVFVLLALGITWWAARRTRTTDQFYAAGRSVTGFQNGLALAGDYMSAASFLGIAGLVALTGFDGLIYSIGFLVGWPIVLFLIAEPLRNLGHYTFADVVAYRLRQKPVRIAAAFGTLSVVIFYLIAQMVGAGHADPSDLRPAVRARGRDRRRRDAHLRALRRHDRDHLGADRQGDAADRRRDRDGLPRPARVRDEPAQSLPGRVETSTAASVLAAREPRLRPLERALARAGADVRDRGAAAHPDALLHRPRRARPPARRSTGRPFFIGFFYLLTFVLGFGAMALVGQAPIKAVDKGGNVAALLLAENVGGTPFLGFIAAVAFATILAVVAGLTLSGAAALSHDLWVNVVRRRRGARARAAPGRPRRDLPDGRSRDRARDRARGPERRLHGRARVRDRGERELPGAPDVDLLARLHDLGRGGEHRRRRRRRRSS